MNDYYQSQSDIGALRSDLACERRRANLEIPGVEYRRRAGDGFAWERIKITSLEGERSIGRPAGNYDTLSTRRMDMLEEDDIENMANEIAAELCYIFDQSGIFPERLLVVGLGNEELTPDSVGPKAAALINATMHLKELDRRAFLNLDCSEIAVFTPGVMARTGIESADTVYSVCQRIKPDAVIAIDSIASRSPERLGTTIQISDTGIFPGSGIGNNRRPINEAAIGSPVIAIGVPTVINAKLLFFSEDSAKNDKADMLSDMFVSPREIDTIASVSSKIIAFGINQAFGIFQ